MVALREGSSLPGLTWADDDGTYVAKFSGASQGAAAPGAEVLVGELARRLCALDPEVDLEAIAAAPDGVVAVRAGEDTAGPVGRLRPRERFGRLTSPRSTVLQPCPVHAGLTEDPERELSRLLDALVR